MTHAASSLLREAREAAHLTQVELAERAGVTQSVISAYESGRRQPALSTLKRLVEATGHRLETAVSGDGELPRDRLRRRRDELDRRLRELGATNIRVFGSVARNEDGPLSDIDLLVDLPDDAGLFALARVRGEAQRILGMPADVVLAAGLKPDLMDAVSREAVPL